MLSISYSKLVLRDYRQKKKRSGFPLELKEPTPRRLRDECLAVCNKRYLPKDEDTLQKFFGDAHDKKTRLKSIQDCDLDKFKPLANFLKESTSTTEFKNIELLAWLIDFKERPWDLAALEPTPDELADPIDAPDGPGEVRTPGDGEGDGEGPGNKTAGEQNKTTPEQKPSNRRKITIVLTITIALAAVEVYRLLPGNISPSVQPNNTFPPIPTGTQACMFWAGTHYQPVPCNEKLGDTVVIALDSAKLMSLTKITRADTITEAAIGHVWYVRYRGNYEFYTAGGFHPLDPNLRLKPITAYIIARHIPHN